MKSTVCDEIPCVVSGFAGDYAAPHRLWSTCVPRVASTAMAAIPVIAAQGRAQSDV